MRSSKAIGGYFELELVRGSLPHQGAVLLNSGRACLEYILRTHTLRSIYLPKLACDVILEPIRKFGLKYSEYSLNENLEIGQSIDLGRDEMLLYINYFGVKDIYCHDLSRKYKEQFILDCSQSFYFKPLRIGHTFYSPRKFFGVPDGGILYTDAELEDELAVDTSFQRSIHLLKRIDLSPEAGYVDFKADDDSLIGQPIKHMSPLTQRILSGIDYESVKRARRDNFNYLHENIGSRNGLHINIFEDTIPMTYPLYLRSESLRKKLIDNKIYIPTYWPNVLRDRHESEVEYQLAKYIFPLPVDQRYNVEDMKTVVETIHSMD